MGRRAHHDNIKANKTAGYFFLKKGEMLFGEYKSLIIFAAPSGEMVRCLSGRKERFAKPSYGLNCTEGSNPSLTASFKALLSSLTAGPFCL